MVCILRNAITVSCFSIMTSIWFRNSSEEITIWSNSFPSYCWINANIPFSIWRLLGDRLRSKSVEDEPKPMEAILFPWKMALHNKWLDDWFQSNELAVLNDSSILAFIWAAESGSRWVGSSRNYIINYFKFCRVFRYKSPRISIDGFVLFIRWGILPN